MISLFPLAEDTGQEGTFEELFAHYQYAVTTWGKDHVAFCSDIYPLPEQPFLHDHDDILVMKHLQEFLLERLDESEVQQVMHDNWIRVLKDAL